MVNAAARASRIFRATDRCRMFLTCGVPVRKTGTLALIFKREECACPRAGQVGWWRGCPSGARRIIGPHDRGPTSLAFLIKRAREVRTACLHRKAVQHACTGGRHGRPAWDAAWQAYVVCSTDGLHGIQRGRHTCHEAHASATERLYAASAGCVGHHVRLRAAADVLRTHQSCVMRVLQLSAFLCVLPRYGGSHSRGASVRMSVLKHGGRL